MAKTNKPRRGSMAFSPRKRAARETPRLHYWPCAEKPGPLGFAGYKAGMTHVMAVDKRDHSITSDLEVFVPVTMLEAPPLKVVGVRAYGAGYGGKRTVSDVIIQTKKSKSKKKESDSKPNLSKLEALKDLTDVALLVETQPGKTNMPKKKPDFMEIQLGGGLSEKFAYAKEKLGGEIKAPEILKENTLYDLTAVTKGKGHQGIVKRWGTRRQPRKSTGRRRHSGTGGAWSPSRKLWLEPQIGQMGYHTRTEYNKLVLKVGANGGDVTPKGGFLRYGPVSGDYVILYGSVPGPSKRLIRFSNPRRAGRGGPFEITHISTKSMQGL